MVFASEFKIPLTDLKINSLAYCQGIIIVG